MAKRTVSPHDLELLSAYLDHQLPPDQRARLEARLQQEPDLQSEYEALQRVQLTLRSLPRRRAPRNFTLTPAMVSARPRPAARLGWGWVSALATVLLLLVLIGDLAVIPEYVGFFPQPRLMAAPEAAQEVSQQPEALSLPEGVPAEAAPEEALVFPTADVTSGATAQAEEPEVKMFAEGGEASTPQATPTAAEALILADQLPPTEEAMRAMESSRAMEATSTPPAAMKQAPTPTATAAEALALESAPAETAEVAAAQSGEVESPPEAPLRQPTPLWVQVVFWMVELLLGIIALGAGALAVYSRFRRFP